MDMIGKVRRMKLRDKFSTSTIAKLTGLPGTLAILQSCNLAILQKKAKFGYL